jgi:hypothetical protein
MLAASGMLSSNAATLRKGRVLHRPGAGGLSGDAVASGA